MTHEKASFRAILLFELSALELGEAAMFLTVQLPSEDWREKCLYEIYSWGTSFLTGRLLRRLLNLIAVSKTDSVSTRAALILLPKMIPKVERVILVFCNLANVFICRHLWLPLSGTAGCDLPSMVTYGIGLPKVLRYFPAAVTQTVYHVSVFKVSIWNLLWEAGKGSLDFTPLARDEVRWYVTRKSSINVPFWTFHTMIIDWWSKWATSKSEIKGAGQISTGWRLRRECSFNFSGSLQVRSLLISSGSWISLVCSWIHSQKLRSWQSQTNGFPEIS